jgi:cytochrome c oxidase subunit 1
MYDERYWVLNVASTAGSTLLAFGFVIILVYLIYSLKAGHVAGANPWDLKGLEWTTSSPPPKHNFDVTPIMDEDPYTYQKKGEEVEHVVL